MKTLDFTAIAAVTTAAKQANERVNSLKSDLQKAELNAVYSDEASAALMEAIFESVCRKITVSEGGKWDNKAQKFDAKGETIVSNLTKLGKVDGMFYNYTNKTAVTLDTEQRVKSFSDALKKEYVRIRKGVKKTRARKDLDERIKAQFVALSAILEGETLINAVAGAMRVTPNKVKEVIK